MRIQGIDASEIVAMAGFLFLWALGIVFSLLTPVVVVWIVLHFAFKYW